MWPIRWSVMAIACVYCGGRHETSAEVRRCWERSNTGNEVTVIQHDRSMVQAMPQLGRNVIVGPGQPAPEGWAAAPRLRIGSAEVDNPPAMVAELRRLADGRGSCVFEIDELSAVALRLRRPTVRRSTNSDPASRSNCRTCTTSCGRTRSTHAEPIMPRGPLLSRRSLSAGTGDRNPTPATSRCPMARWCGSTEGRSVTPSRSTGSRCCTESQSTMVACCRSPPTRPARIWQQISSPPSPIREVRRG